MTFNYDSSFYFDFVKYILVYQISVNSLKNNESNNKLYKK